MGQKNDFKNFGINLEYYRTKSDLTIEQVSGFLEIDQDVYLAYENGADNITLIELHKLEDLYNMELIDLFEPDISKHNKELNRVSLSGMCKSDLKSISNFYKIIRNFIKIKRLSDENK